ncbi:hypothetical protein PC121_g19349 [Phytophthora cactorum]|nr:hypothetical protein PC121_g19349 [Phytophthora cactorum]
MTMLPGETGSADDEWSGSSQPLSTNADDPYLTEEVPISCHSGAGSSGGSQQLKSNCYRVALDTAKCQRIFQYRVTVELGGDAMPTTPGEGADQGSRLLGGRRLVRSLLRQVVSDALQQHPGQFGVIPTVYDGANAIFSPSALPLPDEGAVLNVRCSARNGYGIDTQFVKRGKAQSFTVCVKLAKTLETSLLQTAFSDSAVNVKPLVYALDTVAKAGVVGGRIECRGNYYFRLNPVAKNPLLDVVGNAFVRVTHRITNLKEIVGVSDTSACSTMINVNESSMSVEQYFRKRYQVRLRYPQLPLVNLGGRRPGTESWVPIELCEVAPGQPYSGTDRSNTDTIRSQVVVRPQVRLKSIQQLRERFNTENDPSLEAFGLSVGERMETVAARVLQAPDIQYANSILCPKNGSWNLANKTAVDHFVSNHCKEAVNRRINVVNRKPVMVTSADRPRGSLESWLTCCHDLLERDLSLGHPQLIFVIKANDDAMEYQEIKRTTHAVLGIPSQCVTAPVLGRARVQVLANLCLKISAKLGDGKEWPPVYLVCRCVAASLDRHSSTYAARLAVPSGHNDFSHLPQLLWELFIQHYKHTRRQPKHVVYYRSGVSSSRVGDVVQAEMRSLRKAFRMLATNYEPHVTFIVANSHHHVRLFVSE